jgi:hypothetical protein
LVSQLNWTHRNRLSRNSTISGISSDGYSYDTNDELFADTKGTYITYDTNNNMSTWGSVYAATFDNLNRLYSANNEDYLYDGDNIRYGRTGGQGVFYVVDDVNPSGYDTGKTIGVDISGKATSRIRVVVTPNGKVKTAFPY